MRTGWSVDLSMKRGDIYFITLDKVRLNARPAGALQAEDVLRLHLAL